VRIAVLTSSYPRSPGDAAGHFVRTEARALVRAGHRVTVIAPGPRPRVLPELGSDEPSIVWLADGGAFGWPGALPRLRQRPVRAAGALAFMVRAAVALGRHGPFDHAVAHFLLPCAWPIAVLGLDATTELEVVVHGSDARLFSRLPKPLRTRIARVLMRRVRRVRCVSRAVMDQLAGTGLHSLLHDAAVAPCAIDISGAAGRAEARRALGLDPSEPVAVVVGRLIAGKRADVALAALSLVPRLRVIVIGDGPERRRIESAFPNALFTGRLSRDQTLTYIAAADTLVSASRDEGAPTVVREARALGVTVVAVPAGDLVEQARADRGIVLV
jgi:teichuronic acid biosynthesis glycosyltransferase TuaC